MNSRKQPENARETNRKLCNVQNSFHTIAPFGTSQCSDRAPNTGLIGQAPSPFSQRWRQKAFGSWASSVLWKVPLCTVERVAETKRSLSSGKTAKTQHTATVCAKDVLKLVDILQYCASDRTRSNGSTQLVTDLSRRTLPLRSPHGSRCSSSTMCSPPRDYGERKMPARSS
jgi:hypothetical protein